MKIDKEMDLATIKGIRKTSGLSQRKFGEKYGIPVSTIEAWERGTRTPAPYVLALLAFRVAYDAGASSSQLLALMYNCIEEEKGGEEA